MTYISLFDRLKVLAGELPVSHIADSTDLGKFVSAVVHYIEHGDAILDAADVDAQWAITQLTGPKDLRGPGVEVPSVLTKNDPVPDLVGNSVNVAALQAQIDQLSAALQSRMAAEHVANTTVTVEPVNPEQINFPVPPVNPDLVVTPPSATSDVLSSIPRNETKD